ncbi:MAG: radical SAM protein [Chloroflexota bacterium]|nr:radical SAM protein [Chloroflexota bacterium]
MELNHIVHTLASTGQTKRLTNIIGGAVQRRPLRRLLLRYVDRRFCQPLENGRRDERRRPAAVYRDQADILRALFHSIDRGLERGLISERMMRSMLRGLVNAFTNAEQQAAHDRFVYEHGGRHPPSFLTISPGKLCNLHCKGCYASSGIDSEKLDWEVFDQLITESQELWGSGFVVISGGEPLAYRSRGEDVLDAAARHPDALFLMYTNGTLIDEKVAGRMAEVGNLTPAISVEGFEEKTDARRGEGVFQRVLTAMANLREVGVPFGISLTATCENCEEILSDEFLDFFFEEQGAIYGWIFQYMPIGRGFTLDLLPTPQQRTWMWRRTWQVIREKQYFLADFWNLGTCSSGCISAGHPGGYLYVDWNGKVMPCVFVPYSPVNVNDVYREGKTLNDVLEEPFFQAIREWQDAYGFAATRPEEHGNWLMPCPIRDHHADFRRILQTTEPDPEDEAALQAMIDPSYRDGLMAYDRAVAELMDAVWERAYLQGDGRGQMEQRPVNHSVRSGEER